ncbi:hypothetical protein CALCODRAFT_513416 [Calocera cornea HHB12733]|uniref:Uncharacterized protein n=1 Tax=Calocera cornea HHB12733 TaxID=1353952 RepID=A0A165C4M2_9BASI|nr:hypothetical protein CALCODRAFT_513416 [Calocera cornea HHB12733]
MPRERVDSSSEETVTGNATSNTASDWGSVSRFSQLPGTPEWDGPQHAPPVALVTETPSPANNLNRIAKTNGYCTPDLRRRTAPNVTGFEQRGPPVPRIHTLNLKPVNPHETNPSSSTGPNTSAHLSKTSRQTASVTRQSVGGRTGLQPDARPMRAAVSTAPAPVVKAFILPRPAEQLTIGAPGRSVLDGLRGEGRLSGTGRADNVKSATGFHHSNTRALGSSRHTPGADPGDGRTRVSSSQARSSHTIQQGLDNAPAPRTVRTVVDDVQDLERRLQLAHNQLGAYKTQVSLYEKQLSGLGDRVHLADEQLRTKDEEIRRLKSTLTANGIRSAPHSNSNSISPTFLSSNLNLRPRPVAQTPLNDTAARSASESDPGDQWDEATESPLSRRSRLQLERTEDPTRQSPGTIASTRSEAPASPMAGGDNNPDEGSEEEATMSDGEDRPALDPRLRALCLRRIMSSFHEVMGTSRNSALPRPQAGIVYNESGGQVMIPNFVDETDRRNDRIRRAVVTRTWLRLRNIQDDDLFSPQNRKSLSKAVLLHLCETVTWKSLRDSWRVQNDEASGERKAQNQRTNRRKRRIKYEDRLGACERFATEHSWNPESLLTLDVMSDEWSVCEEDEDIHEWRATAADRLGIRPSLLESGEVVVYEKRKPLWRASGMDLVLKELDAYSGRTEKALRVDMGGYHLRLPRNEVPKQTVGEGRQYENPAYSQSTGRLPANKITHVASINRIVADNIKKCCYANVSWAEEDGAVAESHLLAGYHSHND